MERFSEYESAKNEWLDRKKKEPTPEKDAMDKYMKGR